MGMTAQGAGSKYIRLADFVHQAMLHQKIQSAVDGGGVAPALVNLT